MSDTATPPDNTNIQQSEMGFFEHFDELRSRLIRAVLALLATTLLCAIFTDRIIVYLAGPYEGKLQTLRPTDSVVMYFRVALMSGAILAIPYITYQLFMFILPGLTDQEKRWVLLSIPATTAFFLAGVLFAWFIMVPNAIYFLETFQDDVFESNWTAPEYFSFLTTLLFWIGIAFEMPIFFFVLARIGIVTRKMLIQQWRLAVVVITIAAAMITPTVDPFNMLLVMAPLLVLYLISIVFVGFAASRRRIDEAA
jgi:sec-independent protein translocase protein TatC